MDKTPSFRGQTAAAVVDAPPPDGDKKPTPTWTGRRVSPTKNRRADAAFRFTGAESWTKNRWPRARQILWSAAPHDRICCRGQKTDGIGQANFSRRKSGSLRVIVDKKPRIRPIRSADDRGGMVDVKPPPDESWTENRNLKPHRRKKGGSTPLSRVRDSYFEK